MITDPKILAKFPWVNKNSINQVTEDLIDKVLILEHGGSYELEEESIKYVEKRLNKSWEYFDLRERFWPKNRKSTFDFFASLKENQIIAAKTVFADFIQLEMFIEMLHKLKDKHFTVYLFNPILPDKLLIFLKEKESSITPPELEKQLEEEEITDEEGDEVYKKIYAFKKEMNKKFFEVLTYHTIIWVRCYGLSTQITNLKDLESNKIE